MGVINVVVMCTVIMYCFFLNHWTDIIAFFEESVYRVSETAVDFEVCVVAEGIPVGTTVTFIVESQNNNSADGKNFLQPRFQTECSLN